MERRNGEQATPQADLRETVIMQRVLEFRQKDLEEKFNTFLAERNDRGGDRERLTIAEQRIHSAMCIGKWLAGITGTLIVIFAGWVTFQVWSVRDRDMARQLLQAPPAHQGGQSTPPAPR